MNTPALKVSCPTCGAPKGERCFGSNRFTHTDRHRKHIAYTLHPGNTQGVINEKTMAARARQLQHEEALKLTQSSSFHEIG